MAKKAMATPAVMEINPKVVEQATRRGPKTLPVPLPEGSEDQNLRAIVVEQVVPVLQELAGLYGPTQRSQPDATVMYHANYSNLRVKAVRSAVDIIALLEQMGIVPISEPGLDGKAVAQK